MLTEAKIILPVNDNNGDSLAAKAHDIQYQLLQAFGGYTCTDAHGAWIDPNTGNIYAEPTRVYTLAGVWDDAQVQTLRGIACEAADLMDQLCIYMQTPTHGVEFVEPVHAQLAIAA